MSITISRLGERDWKLLRSLRLAALRDTPGVWGISYARDARQHASHWRRVLADPDNAIYALFDGTHPIGMTGVGLDFQDGTRRQAFMWGSWLEPAYRGRGLTRMIYQTRISWAQTHPSCEILVISHRASNAASRAAALKHGFTFMRAESRVWPDGAVEDNLFYKLQVKTHDNDGNKNRPPE